MSCILFNIIMLLEKLCTLHAANLPHMPTFSDIKLLLTNFIFSSTNEQIHSVVLLNYMYAMTLAVPGMCLMLHLYSWNIQLYSRGWILWSIIWFSYNSRKWSVSMTNLFLSSVGQMGKFILWYFWQEVCNDIVITRNVPDIKSILLEH